MPHRTALLVSGGILYAAVTALLFVFSDPAEAIAVLFVVPIALTALAAGQAAGLAGAGVASLLLLVWKLADDVQFGAVGWVSRLLAFFVIGGLVGRYERLAQEHQRRELGERYAAEVHDRVVQGLVLARYQLEQDDLAEARTSVEGALTGAKQIISDRLGPVEPGDLRLGPEA